MSADEVMDAYPEPEVKDASRPSITPEQWRFIARCFQRERSRLLSHGPSVLAIESIDWIEVQIYQAVDREQQAFDGAKQQ